MPKKLNFTTRLHWFHWFVVGLSMLLTLVAWKISKTHSEEQVQLRFERESNRVVALLKERMNRYEDSLWGGVAAIAANNDKMPYEKWKQFADSLNIEEKFPGINGIGVIFKIRKQDLLVHTRERQKTYPPYKVYPPHNEIEYWPITYIEPESVNKKAVGLDMAHEQNRYTAAKKARDSGVAQITGPITLVQDQTRTPGFLFFAPFYKGEPKNLKARQEKILGLVYAPFVVSKLMAGVLDQEKRPVGIKILDNNEVLYNEHTKDNKYFDETALYKKEVSVPFYGRNWIFDIRSNKTFTIRAENLEPTLILVSGILIDTLLLIIFIILTQSNKEVFQYAEKKNEETEKQKQIAISSSRLASLGEMAASIAHEINNPLAVISGYTGMLQTKLKSETLDSKDLLDTADKIDHTIQRISKIISGLKVMSRDGSQDPFELVEIHTIIDDVLAVCTDKFKLNGIDLHLEVLKERLSIRCRRVAIAQVLTNLFNNAFDAVREQNNAWVILRAHKNDQYLILEIEDSGSGIPEEIRERILEPFFTTKKVGEGTGLGLSISKSIIEEHKGRIEIDAESRHTKFVIHLPYEK